MPEIDLQEFEERLHSLECSEAIREIVAELRKAAERTGPVSWRAHSTPKSGWGITGKRVERVFCRFDPKPKKDHVGVFILDAELNNLRAVGTVSQQKGWVAINTMRGGNERLVPEMIWRAYAAAGVGINRRRAGG